MKKQKKRMKTGIFVISMKYDPKLGELFELREMEFQKKEKKVLIIKNKIMKKRMNKTVKILMPILVDIGNIVTGQKFILQDREIDAEFAVSNEKKRREIHKKNPKTSPSFQNPSQPIIKRSGTREGKPFVPKIKKRSD